MLSKLGALLLVLGWFSTTASAQSWQVTTWHVDDGLPNVNVTAIAQTPDGYLWVGTRAGLARFDGLRFKVFRADGNCGLEDSRIVNLITDRDGTLWVGTLGGTLSLLRGQRFETVRHPLPVDADSSQPPGSWLKGRQSFLLQDSDGGIWWCVTGKGVARFLNGRWTVFTEKDGLPAQLAHLACDQRGGVWAEGGGKLMQFDGQRWESRLELPPGWSSAPFAQFAQDGLWIVSFRGGSVRPGLICRSDQKPAFMTSAPTTPSNKAGPQGVTAMLEDRQGRWWAALGNGGLCWLDQQGHWRPLENPGMLGLPSITCLFEDRQGNLWAGSIDFGLHRLAAEPMSRVQAVESPDMTFTACYTRDGAVWVGTRYAGVVRRVDKEFEPVPGEWGSSPPTVLSLLEDSRGIVWAGTDNGLFRFENGRFQREKTPFPNSTNVSAILEDRAGTLWFGTNAGLFARHAGQYQSYPIGADIRTLAEDATGTLWVGTIGSGLFRLSTDAPRKVEMVKTCPTRDIRNLYIDPNGTLWIGSWGDGLFRYRAGQFEKFASDCFPSGKFQEIFSDQHGTLWAATLDGIFSIPRRVADDFEAGKSPPLLWRRLSSRLALNQRTCSGSGSPVAAHSPDGRLWFPNIEYIAVVDSTLVRSGLEPASVRIEAVTLDGKEVSVSPGSALRAASATRQFEFQYTALDLTSPSALVFRTKLEGMDRDWIDAGGSRSARYSKLPPGDYQFRVMAGGVDGQWREAAAPLQIAVIPRWWERGWVQLMGAGAAILTAAGTALLYQKRKTRAKLREIQVERQLEAERSRIARDIHDEMGASLTHIKMLSTLARKATPHEPNLELDQINETSRDLTRVMDEIVWAVDPRHDTLDSLANYLGRTVQKNLSAAGVRCELQIPLAIPKVQMTSRIRHNVFLVLKEALNNVIKHASATDVIFQLELGEREFTLILKDNGKGFPMDADSNRRDEDCASDRISSGNGLKNMGIRAQEAGGRLEIASQPGQGTRLSLWIPFAPQS